MWTCNDETHAWHEQTHIFSRAIGIGKKEEFKNSRWGGGGLMSPCMRAATEREKFG